MKWALLLVIQLILCIALVVCLFCFPTAAHLGAEQGMAIFLDILLPYLLPYILLTTWLFSILNSVKSSPNVNFFISYITSAIGGYPVGAITSATLLEQGVISKKQAQWLLPFLHSPNPFFVINFVGRDLLGNLSFSIYYLILHHSICSVCAYIIFKKGNTKKTLRAEQASFQLIIDKTATTLITVAVTIIFFSCLSFIAVELLRDHVTTTALAFIIGSLELTNGLQFAHEILNPAFLPLYFAFLLSAQSISIHLQIAAVTANTSLSLNPYMLVRIIYTVLFTVLFYIIL